jgi:hypothetical protein
VTLAFPSYFLGSSTNFSAPELHEACSLHWEPPPAPPTSPTSEDCSFPLVLGGQLDHLAPTLGSGHKLTSLGPLFAAWITQGGPSLLVTPCCCVHHEGGTLALGSMLPCTWPGTEQVHMELGK